MAQDENMEFITHTNTRNPNNNNQLDFILTNMLFQNTKVYPELDRISDHIPLSTDLEPVKKPK